MAVEAHQWEAWNLDAVAVGADGVSLFSRGAMTPEHFEAARRVLRQAEPATASLHT